MNNLIRAHHDRVDAVLAKIQITELDLKPIIRTSQSDHHHPVQVQQPINGVDFIGADLHPVTHEPIYIVRLTSDAAGFLIEAVSRVRTDERWFWHS